MMVSDEKFNALEQVSSDVLEHHYMMMTRIMRGHVSDVAALFEERKHTEELERNQDILEARLADAEAALDNAMDKKFGIVCARCGEHISREEAWIRGEST